MYAAGCAEVRSHEPVMLIDKADLRSLPLKLPLLQSAMPRWRQWLNDDLPEVLSVAAAPKRGTIRTYLDLAQQIAERGYR